MLRPHEKCIYQQNTDMTTDLRKYTNLGVWVQKTFSLKTYFEEKGDYHLLETIPLIEFEGSQWSYYQEEYRYTQYVRNSQRLMVFMLIVKVYYKI